MMHDLLSSALRRATEALHGDDAISAASALHDAALACEAALRQGSWLEPAQLVAVRPVYAECGAAIDATRRRISEALGALGQASRAGGAYRR